YGDVVPGQRGNILDLLAEDKDQNRCGLVACGQGVAVLYSVQGGVLVGGAECGAVTAAMAGHGEPLWGVFGVHGPAEEPIDEQSSGRPAGNPGVNLALADVGERDVALAEPVEEVDRDGDGLLAA